MKVAGQSDHCSCLLSSCFWNRSNFGQNFSPFILVSAGSLCKVLSLTKNRNIEEGYFSNSNLFRSCLMLKMLFFNTLRIRSHLVNNQPNLNNFLHIFYIFIIDSTHLIILAPWINFWLIWQFPAYLLELCSVLSRVLIQANRRNVMQSLRKTVSFSPSSLHHRFVSNKMASRPKMSKFRPPMDMNKVKTLA